MLYFLLAGISIAIFLIGSLIFRHRELQKKITHSEKLISEFRDSFAREQKGNKSQLELLRKQLKSREESLKAERKRIAADLHDDVIQRMVVLRIQLEQLLYYPIPDRAEAEIKLLHRELEKIMGDIRYLIDDLVHPKFESQTFTELVKGMAERLGRVLHRKVTFELQHEAQEFYIAPSIKRELYYIVQEAAQNSLNHSVAFILQITLSWQNGLLVIIEDDGQGLLKRGRGEGYGMASIQKRAEGIGANLEIGSASRGLMIVLEYNGSQ
ncbi:MAG TPA: histidine kinase [Cyclobacteriaceae bacterium]|nr:histidine kinase [Cyclobacteriaceae bacterium]HRJ82716.1 histidine kinase [Cyclobacteriaceae bacterium]